MRTDAVNPGRQQVWPRCKTCGLETKPPVCAALFRFAAGGGINMGFLNGKPMFERNRPTGI